MNPQLDIIIVNWNAGIQLTETLESIAKTQKIGFRFGRAVVVDNASSDGSTDFPGKIDLPLQVIRNTVNRGFSAACNLGASTGAADYLLFLNPDVTLLNDSLWKPISFMEDAAHKSIGIVGIQLLDGKNNVSRTCARFPTAGRFFAAMIGLNRLFPGAFKDHFMLEWDHKESRTVDQVMGAFFLVRGSLFRSLGGFDERFFVYFEEVDFSLRARKAGFETYFLAEAAAYHKGGGTSDQVRSLRLFYSLRSRLLYAYKHFPRPAATALALGTLILEPFTRILYAGFRLSFREIAETIKAYLRLWRITPGLILTRGRSVK